MANSTQKSSSNQYRLTNKEQEILALIQEDLTNHQIAIRLVVSIETVRTHCKHLREKMMEDYPRRKQTWRK
jgi:DNA-binding CsgD family transcriptional regulator